MGETKGETGSCSEGIRTRGQREWKTLRASEGRQNENHNHRLLISLFTWSTVLSNSMKPWAIPCRATQDGQVMVESFDKMWSTGEGNGKPIQYSVLENPMNYMKRQKNMTLKDELLRLVDAQYATIEEWRNNSRRNEDIEPKWKQCPVMDVTLVIWWWTGKPGVL